MFNNRVDVVLLGKNIFVICMVKKNSESFGSTDFQKSQQLILKKNGKYD